MSVNDLMEDLYWQITLITSAVCLVSAIPTLILIIRRHKQVRKAWFVLATILATLSAGNGITVLAGTIHFGY